MENQNVNKSIDSIQQQQDDEYSFPYHYVVKKTERGFSQCFNDVWGINYLATIEYLLLQIEKESFETVIDIGCGDGRFTRELAQRFPGRQIIGMDFSSRAIALAKAMSPDIDFRCVDIISQPCVERFDLAVLMEVYEHIEPDSCPEFSRSLARLIKRGGLLYLTVPHVNKLIEYKHYRHFTSEILIQEMSHDFEVLDVVFIEKRSYLKKLIDFILANGIFILNNKYLCNCLYEYYKSHLFLAQNENCCQRIIARFRRRSH